MSCGLTILPHSTHLNLQNMWSWHFTWKWCHPTAFLLNLSWWKYLSWRNKMGDFLINFSKKKIVKYSLMCSQIRWFQIKCTSFTFAYVTVEIQNFKICVFWAIQGKWEPLFSFPLVNYLFCAKEFLAWPWLVLCYARLSMTYFLLLNLLSQSLLWSTWTMWERASTPI